MTDDMERRVATPMRFAYREVVTPSMVGLVAGVSLTLMAIVSVLGPMQTLHTLTLVQRFAYYGVITAVLVPICFACGVFTLYVMRNRGLMLMGLSLILMCSVVVAPGVGLAVITYALFHGGRSPEASLISIYLFGLLIFGGGTILVFYVLSFRLSRTTQRNSGPTRASEGAHAGLDCVEDTTVQTSVISTASEADDPSQQSSSAPGIEPVPAEPEATDQASGSASPQDNIPELRLPGNLRENIVYVHVSGHYVEIVTTSATEVLLMRLSDVARALEGQGMQTHRSYWVAYRHILRMEKYERRAVLHLTGEHKVPVSRSFRGEVEAFMEERERSWQ